MFPVFQFPGVLLAFFEVTSHVSHIFHFLSLFSAPFVVFLPHLIYSPHVSFPISLPSLTLILHPPVSSAYYPRIPPLFQLFYPRIPRYSSCLFLSFPALTLLVCG